MAKAHLYLREENDIATRTLIKKNLKKVKSQRDETAWALFKDALLETQHRHILLTEKGI